MRSKSVTVALLLASLTLAACDEDGAKNPYGDGMAFESFEDCAVNIGKENCEPAPVQQQVTQSQTSGTNGGYVNHTSIVPIFLPHPGFHGGYLHDAPRMSPTYTPSKPIFASTPAARSGTFVSSSRSGFSSSSRGGFGSVSRSFSASS